MASNASSDNVWDGDLFDRWKEADQIHSYIRSVSSRPIKREDKSSFTLSIEGGYGQGKTFFLKRLAQHLEKEHAVAYCDAWADDFTDEPLTALAATLKIALGQFQNQTKVQTLLEKTGAVSKVVGKGLLRRGAGLLITDGAVAALDALEFEVKGEAAKDAEKLGDGLATDTAARPEQTAKKLILDRIAAFEDGRRAIAEVRESLLSIIENLSDEGLNPPIIIIIDELDRCRPNYAIKLLEEIKHLFDVNGIVFVLGINSEQLAHSISGIYGLNFDGHAYLKRFIDRSYTLLDPPLEKLLNALWAQASLEARQFELPQIVIPGERGIEAHIPDFIAEIMRHYGLGARDAFQVMDMLQTGAALVEGQRIFLPYYLALAIGIIQGRDIGVLPAVKKPTRWHYLTTNWRHGSDGNPVAHQAYVERLSELLALPSDVLQENAEKDGASSLEVIAARANSFSYDEPPLWSVLSYDRLLRSVSRFSNPEREEDEAKRSE